MQRRIQHDVSDLLKVIAVTHTTSCPWPMQFRVRDPYSAVTDLYNTVAVSYIYVQHRARELYNVVSMT